MSPTEIKNNYEIYKERQRFDEEATKSGHKHFETQEEIARLRRVKAVVASAVHPDSGEVIPFPMRMCAFVPMNMPIVCGMLLAAPTPFNTAFWQWANQTYNAGMNFGNRNATSG